MWKLESKCSKLKLKCSEGNWKLKIAGIGSRNAATIKLVLTAKTKTIKPRKLVLL